VDVRILPDCNHFYAGHEDKLSELVSGWLSDVLG
jgi:alpha/beta superfamily hydrolase